MELFFRILLGFISVMMPLGLALGIKYRVRSEAPGKMSKLSALSVVVWLVTFTFGAPYLAYLAVSLVQDWDHLRTVEDVVGLLAIGNIVVQLLAAKAMYKQIESFSPRAQR